VKSTKSLGVVFLAVAWCMSAYPQAVKIDSTTQWGPTKDPRVMIAVPVFAAAPGLEAVAKEMADAVAFDLEFSGLFLTLPRQNYPLSFAGFTANYMDIDFSSWRTTTATYLAYGVVTKQGANIVAECRMFDVAGGTPVMGQQFSSQETNYRLLAHRYSEEIIRQIDGVPGCATSMIVFSGKTSGGAKELFLSDYDGRNPRQITKYNSISIKPKISPDGKKIAFVSYKDRYPFLYMLDIASGQSTVLSKRVGLNSAPAWAPDSKRLAYTLSKDGNTEIYIKNADGSGEQRLTNDRGGDTSPTFDPTGTRIAFVSDRVGAPQIFGMNADGSGIKRLSFQGGKSYDPVWSPDGRMIAYVVEMGGMHIYVMDADGQNARCVSTAGSNNESPSWSPDSRNVIFSNPQGIFAACVNIQQQFTIPMKFRGEGPSWGPRRG